MEKLPKETKNRLIKILVEKSPIGYLIVDDEFKIHYANPAYEKIREVKLEDIEGQICYDLSNEGNKCNECIMCKTRDSGEISHVRRKEILESGKVNFVDIYALPLATNKNGKKFFLQIFVDITKAMLAKEKKYMAYDKMLRVLSGLIDAKDTYTAMHSNNVQKVSYKIAKQMNLSLNDIYKIAIAANIHDIGKVYIPIDIINKPGKLTDEEYTIIKDHPVFSYDMLVDFEKFDEIRDIVRYHHERIDGKGYPDNLKADEIPLGARIIAVADSYDAMTSNRAYRKALSREFAIDEIKKNVGTQFDAEVVEVFLQIDLDKEEEIVINEDEEEIYEIKIKSKKNCCGKEVKKDIQGFEHIITYIGIDELLSKIFYYTPCGYFVSNKNLEILLLNKYAADIAASTVDAMIGRLCYKAYQMGDKPCEDCVVRKSYETGEIEYKTIDNILATGRHISDLYAVPLSVEGDETYTMEILLNRTEEVIYEENISNDFKKLINILSNIADENKEELNFSTTVAEIHEQIQIINNIL